MVELTTGCWSWTKLKRSCAFGDSHQNRIKRSIFQKFGFISNDNISRIHLWKDGIHLEDLDTNIPAGNFVDFLNRFIFSKSFMTIYR